MSDVLADPLFPGDPDEKIVVRRTLEYRGTRQELERHLALRGVKGTCQMWRNQVTIVEQELREVLP